MVLGPSPGGAQAEGEKTSGSENETRLVAAGPPWWAVAGLAAALRPGSQPQQSGLPGMVSTSVQAFRQLTETVRDTHGGGWSRKINARYLHTLMVYL